MPKRQDLIGPAEVREKLRRRIFDEMLTQKSFAAAYGVNPSVVSDVVQGRIAPTDSVLSVLGLERVYMYRVKE